MEGLETLDYLDNLCNRERFTEQGDALTFESEVMHPSLVLIVHYHRVELLVMLCLFSLG